MQVIRENLDDREGKPDWTPAENALAAVFFSLKYNNWTEHLETDMSLLEV